MNAANARYLVLVLAPDDTDVIAYSVFGVGITSLTHYYTPPVAAIDPDWNKIAAYFAPLTVNVLGGSAETPLARALMAALPKDAEFVEADAHRRGMIVEQWKRGGANGHT